MYELIIRARIKKYFWRDAGVGAIEGI